MPKQKADLKQKEGSNQKVGPNQKVTLHFSLHLADGSLIDSTRELSKPASFVFGDGNLLPNIEELLLGFSAGDKRSFVLSPKKAFGEYNFENEQTFPRTQFKDIELEEGLLIGFDDASGEQLPGLVKSINEQFVLIDFNHPLAGKEIIFEAEILAVEPMNAEKLVNWIEQAAKKY